MPTITCIDDLKALREQVVRTHMQSENTQQFDETIGTFSHPYYELVATGEVFDGEQAVRDYYRASRAATPDQRNELIAMHSTDDAVIVEFWLRGTPAGSARGFESATAGHVGIAQVWVAANSPCQIPYGVCADV